MRGVTVVEELRDAGEGLAFQPWLGRSAPIAESDGGLAPVMDFDDGELRAVFPRRHAPAEVDAFTDRVRRMRRDRVLAHESPEDAGIVSFSAPVVDAGGCVAAAACIAGPVERLRPRRAELLLGVRRLAEEVSDLLRALALPTGR